MAFDLLRSAKHIRDLSNAEFRVLFYLLDEARQDTHKCFPSLKKIAAFTEMSERTVQRHISALAERGLFERIEQRRKDGSRAVNCYQFVAVGEIKIGREPSVKLAAEPETEEEQPPASFDGLDNLPFLTPPPVENDTTPRQDCRDLDQDSRPGIESYTPPHSTNVALPGLIGEEPLNLIDYIEKRWAQIKERHPGIAGIRKIDNGMHHTIALRASQHAKDGQSIRGLWDEFLDTIERSKFLCGEAPPGVGRDKPFKLTFTWALTAHHFREIIGGKYTDADGGGAAGRRLGPTAKATLGALEGIRASRQRRGQGGDQGRNYG